MPRGDPFYRRNDVDSIKKISKDAAGPSPESEGIVRSVNNSGAQVQLRGASNWTPADIVQGLSVSPDDHVLLKRSSQVSRWIIYAVYNPKGLQGSSKPSGSSSGGASVVAPSDLQVREEGNAWIISWTPPDTQGGITYELEIADDTSETNQVTYRVSGSSFTIPASQLDSLYFRIRSLGQNWTRSGWTEWSQRSDIEYIGNLDVVDRILCVKDKHQIIYSGKVSVTGDGQIQAVGSGRIIVISE